MANISSAIGRFIFEESFAEKHGDLIQNWIDNHIKSCYGFDLTDDKLDSDGSITFHADGHWTYSETLGREGIGWTDGPADSESVKAVKALAKSLADEKSEVCVEYTDLESSLGNFYESRAKLFYKNEREFEGTEELTDLDFNLENICKKGFECAAYDFDEEEDKEKFKNYINEKFSGSLKGLGIEADGFCDKVIEMSFADDYRKGIILKWEAEDFKQLCSIGKVNT